MDFIIRGSIAGIIGMASCTGVNYIVYKLGIVPFTGYQYNALYLNAPGVTFNTMTISIGLIAGFVTGAFVGVITAYLIERTGYDYAWFKGIGVGAVLWPVHVAIIPNAVARLYSVLPPVMVLACFFFEVIFGFVTGGIIKVLYIRNEQSNITGNRRTVIPSPAMKKNRD